MCFNFVSMIVTIINSNSNSNSTNNNNNNNIALLLAFEGEGYEGRPRAGSILAEISGASKTSC